MPKIDWKKARLDYITDESMSYAKLAKKYHLNESTITRHSQKNGWIDLRKATMQKANELLPEKAGQQIADFQAEKLKIGKWMVGIGVKGLQDNPPTKAKEAKEIVKTGYKLATEAMGLDKPNVEFNLNQQNNYLTLDQLFANIERKAEEERKLEENN